MEPEKPVSIRDVAERAGVSISTVSRVMNNTGRFSQATRDHVMKVVAETGYVTNMAAKSLRERRTKTIGIIVPDISNDFFSMLTLHVEQFLAQEDFAVFICNSANNPERERTYLKMLASKQVDGIVFINGTHELADDEAPRGIPLVCIDRFVPTGNAPRVVSDDIAGMRLATRHLIERGCTRPLFLSRATEHRDRRLRETGYLQELEAHGIVHDPAYMLYPQGTRPSREEAKELVEGFIAQGLPFDGIVAVSDHAAAGALEALHHAGIDVPSQVKLVGYDDSSYSKVTTPKITSIHRFPQQLAQKGCEALLQLIDGETPAKETIIPVELVERESSAA